MKRIGFVAVILAATAFALLPLLAFGDAPKFTVKAGTLPAVKEDPPSILLSNPVGDLRKAGCKIRPDLGSGINTDAGVLTALHVVRDAINKGKKLEIDCEGEVAEARLVFQDPKTDVAVLSVPWKRDHPKAKFRSSRPKVGDQVKSVARLRDGSIGIEEHRISDSTSDGFIVVENPFISGSSGGGIFDEAGELLGIIHGNIVDKEPWRGLVIPIREFQNFSGRNPKLVFSSVPWFNNGRNTDKEHLIRDHGYKAEDLEGLTADQLNRLHGTAHGSPAMASQGNAAPVYQTICNGRSCRRVRVR